MTKHIPASEMRESTERKRVTLPLAPSLEQRRLQLYLVLLLLDALAIFAGTGTASWLQLPAGLKPVLKPSGNPRCC